MFCRLLLIFLTFGATRLFSADMLSVVQLSGELGIELSSKMVLITEAEILSYTDNLRPHPILAAFKRKEGKRRKLTAALIAFPFPFGMVGLHRIYLGCAPYVPVVYIASLGGVFGLIPLIDCIVLLASKDISKYEDSQKVFIWIDE